MDRLHPVERGGGVRKLANAVVEAALAAPDAAEIEPQRRETARGEGLVQRLGDAIVHRAARLGVGMKDHGDGRARARAGLEAALETAFGSGKDHCGHVFLT